MDDLATATRDLRTHVEARPIVISTLPVFMEKWLTPYLSDFQNGHPDIRFRFDFHDGISTGGRGFSFGPDIDAMIVYVERPPEGFQSERLFGEKLVPVCSPTLRAAMPDTLTLRDILSQTRLQDTFWPDDWSVWARAMGHPGNLQAPELSFALYNGLIQSVKSGMGVAIGHSAMIRRELEAGDLVAFDAFAIDAPESYYFVTRRSLRNNPKLAAFWKWILKCSGNS
ncbi:LysR substrate-binding domain-containing protein [Aliisedimentitalea scapharcae]|uniref:LysR substrate-binding domain-containing protein n=1 Tax=Aliisedimentitalea scapharcae TaxID=1524259 RepID=A0ABZ2XRD5_9RHOB